GLHLVFRYDPKEFPGGLKTKTLWKGKNSHSEVKLKGEGGYIVAPPSIHPDTGKPYLQGNDNIPILLTASEINELINAFKVTPDRAIQNTTIQEPIAYDNTLTAEKMQKLLAKIEPLYTKGNRNDWVFNL